MTFVLCVKCPQFLAAQRLESADIFPPICIGGKQFPHWCPMGNVFTFWLLSGQKVRTFVLHKWCPHFLAAGRPKSEDIHNTNDGSPPHLTSASPSMVGDRDEEYESEFPV